MMSNCKNVMSFEKIKLRFFFFLPHPDRTRQQILDFWCLKDIYCLFKHNEYLKKKPQKPTMRKTWDTGLWRNLLEKKGSIVWSK